MKIKHKAFFTGMLATLLTLGLVLAGCSKKDSAFTAAKSGGDKENSAKTVSDAIKQTSEAYSDAIEDATEDINAVAGLAAAAESTTKSSSSSNVNWKKAMDDYEKFVDDYVGFMKKYKANPNDLSLLTEYASMAEKATTASDSISKLQSSLSGSDLTEFTARYTKIAAKMASAL